MKIFIGLLLWLIQVACNLKSYDSRILNGIIIAGVPGEKP